MLDLRVYRAAFVPAVVALFVAAFSLADRPAPATTADPAEVFDAAGAFGDETRPQRNSLHELARAFPDRRPGSAGDAGLAARVAETLGQSGAYRVTRTRTNGLETVVAVRPGLSSRRIVVLAGRDARARPGLAELSATAALLEIARVYRERDLNRTLVLVSTSGTTTGFAPSRAWARQAANAPVDAVLVLGDMAGARVRKPWVVPWSTSSPPAPLALQRTVEAALRAKVDRNVGGSRASGQWVRRALPLTLSGQGVVNAQGLPAVFVGASGERGPAPGEPVSRARLGAFGRGVLRAIIAIDHARPAGDRSPFAARAGGLVVQRNVLPDWAVRMLVGALLLPALLAALDAWFRARRRRLPAGRWAAWVATAAAPVVLVWLWLRVLGLTGAVEVPDAPVAPEVFPPGTAGVVALASAAVVAAVGWFGVRPLLLRRTAVSGNPAAGGLAAATGLLTNGVAAAAWMFNPYAAALLLPAAHLWLLAAAPGSRMRRGTTALAVAAGLALPVLAVAHYARALGLGPLDLAWLGGMVFANGHVSLPAALATALWLAALSGVVTAVRARRRVEAAVPPQPLRTRGPRNYAGPGSLGGTESALRR